MSRPPRKSAQPKRRSKAAQATADARAARAQAPLSQLIAEEAEAHPDAVQFQSKGAVDEALYERVLQGHSEKDQRSMSRQALLMGLIVLAAAGYFFSKALSGG